MNPKCLGRAVPDTFSAKSADSTGLKMRRITRAVLFDRIAFGRRQPGPDCRISNWRGAVRSYLAGGLQSFPQSSSALRATADVWRNYLDNTFWCVHFARRDRVL